MDHRRSRGLGAVRLHDFGWRYSSRHRPALTGLDLDVAPGERILLTGESGAGKSTLLSAIAGTPGEGESRGRLEAAGTVGLVPQDPRAQITASRIGDTVAATCERFGLPREVIGYRVPAALEMVGLGLPPHHPTHTLSEGQKKRLALAGVMALNPDIILLDEPTAQLDPEGRRGVVAAVEELVDATGATLLIAEHRARHWEPVVDRILHLGSDGIAETSATRPSTPPAEPPTREPHTRAPVLVDARDLLTAWGPPRTLALPEGTSTVLTGPNGSGKTTLALTLAGLAEPRGGVLDYASTLRRGLPGPAHTWSPRQLAERIGLVRQYPGRRWTTRTVADELAAGGEDPARGTGLLERLALTHLLDAHPGTLSGGEMRRLSVATALAPGPGLLILDEPTFGQDDHALTGLVGLLRELKEQGTTIVSVTHDETFLAVLCDREVHVR